MQTVLAVLAAILGFGFLIFTHELGHFLAARAFHVRVQEFSIGFGPRLLWYVSKKSGTKYSLAMIPFGGFVSMEGEDTPAEGDGALCSKPAWQRLIIMAAGAFVNLLTGFLLTLVIVASSTLGSTVVYDHPEEMKGNYSTAEFLQQDDRILAVGGTRVHTAEELQYAIMRHGNEPTEVRLQRGEEELTLTVQFATVTESGQTVGVTDFRVYGLQKDFGRVMEHTFYRSVSTVRMVWDSFADLIRGRYTIEALSGPIGITGAIGETVGQAGVSFGDRAYMFAYFMALIAINLGVVNLFPLPALDGGRVLLLLIEVIIRRPIPQKVEGVIHAVGMVLLFGLMIFIAVKDVIGLFV